MILSAALIFFKSFSLPNSPNWISAAIFLEITSVPNIGKTWNCFPSTSNVETILEPVSLYVAPTVIAFGFAPGLPIVFSSGPLFPAATTTITPLSTASFTAWSISLCITSTPKLMLIMSASSIIACFIALIIKSEETASPSSETL